MDPARYAVAVLVLVAYPSGLVFWLVVHPFVTTWRRVGPVGTYTASLGIVALVGATLFVFRATLLIADLGTQGVLVATAGLVMAAGLSVEIGCRRLLTLRTLVGVPEIRDEREGVLLQDGLYGWVRHPRYLGGTLGLVASALFANHLGTYLVVLIFLPGIYVIAVLEERELVARFGNAYRAYQQRVPRLLPRRWRW